MASVSSQDIRCVVDISSRSSSHRLNVVAARSNTIEVETREACRQRALARLASMNWTLPLDYKLDRDEANER